MVTSFIQTNIKNGGFWLNFFFREPSPGPAISKSARFRVFHLNPDLAKTVYRVILKFSQMQDDEFLQNLTQFIREIFNILEDFRILVVFLKKYVNFR